MEEESWRGSDSGKTLFTPMKVHTGSAAHQVSYSMDAERFFAAIKAAGT
jgi:hypothetical protein